MSYALEPSAPSVAVSLAGTPWRRALARAVVPVVLAAVFFRASNLPITPVDTWSHWKHGEWIWQHGRLPDRDLFGYTSEPGLRLADTAWLSQVVGYLVYRGAGMEGIALLYGVLELLKALFLLLAGRRATGSLGWALVGVIVFQAARGNFYGVFRPQVIGDVCWFALLWLCVRPPLTRVAVAVIPAVFALWANLHGAFLLGYVLLAVILAGHFVEQVRTQRSLARAFADGGVRRLALALGLSVAAACVNPYGPKLLLEVVRFSKLPILQAVTEWQPLVPLFDFDGKMLALSFLLVLVTLRLSPRRFAAGEVGLLLLFGLSAWFTARMAPWWATLWPLLLLPHWQALAPWSDEPPARHSTVLGASLMILGWFGAGALVLASGSGRWLLHGEARATAVQTSADTPVRLAESLADWMSRREAAGHGRPWRVYASFRWNDYLLWKLPPQTRFYFYSFVHWFDVERFNDRIYLEEMHDGPHDWRGLLERYRIDVLVLQAQPSTALFEAFHGPRRPEEWDVIYDDATPGDTLGRGLIAVRRVDSFAEQLTAVDAAQGCVGALGQTPLAGTWRALARLPWYGKK
jgi:hypothetical protein